MGNRRSIQLLSIPTVLLGAALLVSAARAGSAAITRVSLATDGTQPNNDVFPSGISSDGRYVPMSSEATNLVAGDTNNAVDVFVRDRQTNETTRVSVASDGSQANAGSSGGAISADGRFVAFCSEASNLVSGDTNGAWDVFVRDRQTDTTSRVSVSTGGTQSDASCGEVSISGNGHYVAFSSFANNLVPGDINNGEDIFVRDTQTGTTTRVSVASNGVQGNSGSDSPSLSADGRFVSFYSNASNLVAGDTNGTGDIFVHDRQTGETTLVSVASDGTQANEYSFVASISSNGRYVVFQTHASNLVSGDTNGLPDIFVHDRQTGLTTCASVAFDGSNANDQSLFASISADGRYVGFTSGASNLVRDDTNDTWDVFIRDMQTGTTTRITLAPDGAQSNESSTTYLSSLSADGKTMAFGSVATNLVDGVTNGHWNTFVYSPALTQTARSQPKALPATGFAPGRISSLPAQPADKLYSADAGLSLEIPALGVRAPIVGVPLGADGRWDVTWLGREAGYLAGTAYPTWQGNSVIAGHVWDADNRPGIFAHLKELKYGDQLRIHGWGQVYIYEVRENRLAWPDQTDVVLKHEDRPWVTLLTCEDFNALFSGYSMRRIVRAVLVGVIAEK